MKNQNVIPNDRLKIGQIVIVLENGKEIDKGRIIGIEGDDVQMIDDENIGFSYDMKNVQFKYHVPRIPKIPSV